MKHLEAGSVRVMIKGGRQEEIAVASFAIPALDEYLCLRKPFIPDESLFITTAGKPWNRKRVWESLKPIQEEACVPTGLHYFRVTTISRLGHDYALARDVARHSTRNVTERYTPTTLVERREAIEQAYQHLTIS